MTRFRSNIGLSRRRTQLKRFTLRYRMSTRQSIATSANTVSKQESLTLIRNMIRISVSSICYIRQLFPDDCFKTRNYGSIEIHQLHCGEKDNDGDIKIINEEAFLVTQWLQNGVFKALDSGYVSSLIFIIYTKHPVTKKDTILETYEFKITYPDGNNAASINDIQLFSKESVKQQASHFIRALIDFCGTLDSIPEDRWITLQLQYTANTPKDYEPEYFEAASQSLLLGRTFPLKVNIGDIQTQEMRMKMRFAGLESLFVDELETPLPIVTKKPSVLQAKKHIIEDDSTPVAKEPQLSQQLAADVTAMTIDPQLDSVNPLSQQGHHLSSMSEEYVLIKDHIESGNIPQIKSFSLDLSLHENIVRDIFNRLYKEGMLERKKVGKYYRYEWIRTNNFRTPVPSKLKKKRGLDEETCIDENEKVDNVASESKAHTPKWKRPLEIVEEQKKNNTDKQRKSNTNLVPAPTSTKKVQDIPSSQMSEMDPAISHKYSKVRDPLHLTASKRQRLQL